MRVTGLDEKFYHDNRCHSTFKYYDPPEIAENLPGSITYDVYCLGLIIYQLLTGDIDLLHCPLVTFGNRSKSTFQWMNINTELKDLLRKMCHPKPKSRPSPEEVLSHRLLVETVVININNRPIMKSLDHRSSAPAELNTDVEEEDVEGDPLTNKMAPITQIFSSPSRIFNC
eukprot:TRINITY_DN19880_c0_g1_i1.p1 TRINITY_DN19880_c0_g1~~TRINITY_DN19880_c0_g1_i1.p1  ORF type:complete len:171 (-),score=5.30 TRINITY_DN19880_c0_g1_i1:33-545(-)